MVPGRSAKAAINRAGADILPGPLFHCGIAAGRLYAPVWLETLNFAPSLLYCSSLSPLGRGSS
ncbi:hypothetical protein C8R21_10888 [Nitrosospira multiformis]|uniref:Uncharacterized protein n=1 Tax=Nitrosospira multiformis TaxID=1231 RepID=A0A2T5ID11_9PROT|nr:hypothetical protein C8R21_10888 [Nitrosospira multiformis]